MIQDLLFDVIRYLPYISYGTTLTHVTLLSLAPAFFAGEQLEIGLEIVSGLTVAPSQHSIMYSSACGL